MSLFLLGLALVSHKGGPRKGVITISVLTTVFWGPRHLLPSGMGVYLSREREFGVFVGRLFRFSCRLAVRIFSHVPVMSLPQKRSGGMATSFGMTFAYFNVSTLFQFIVSSLCVEGVRILFIVCLW